MFFQIILKLIWRIGKLQKLLWILIELFKALRLLQRVAHLHIGKLALLKLIYLIFQFPELLFGYFCSDAGIASIIRLSQMAENVIAVGIAVRCHPITNLVQFFHCLALVNTSQVSFQTHVHIRFGSRNSIVQSSFLCLRLVPFDRRCIYKINFLIFLFLHSTEYFCRIQCILRCCHKAVFDASQSSFDRVFPFFICNIKQICKDLHMNRTSILTAEFTLQLGSRTFQLFPVWLAVIFQILHHFLLLIQLSRCQTNTFI